MKVLKFYLFVDSIEFGLGYWANHGYLRKYVGILTYFEKYRYLTLSMVNEYKIYIGNEAISYFIDCYINT